MKPKITRQYITDEGGKRIGVILDIGEYEQILERLEDLDDIQEYRKMKPLVDQDIQEGHYLTLEEAKLKYGKE